MSRYALTGATGFVGGALARRLLATGHRVSALVRNPGQASDLVDHGATLVAGELADGAALDELCNGVEGLFHVAGWYKVGSTDNELAREVNVEGTRAVIDAVRRAGIPKLVHTSTLAVNSDTGGALVDETYRFSGTHLSAYDFTKAAAHELARAAAASGLPVVTVMPGLVYGPGDTSQTGALIADVVAGRRPFVPSGGRLSWAHVDDVADGHVLAMERGVVGEDYMLAGPPASLAEGLTLVAEICRTRPPRIIPDAIVGAVGRAAGLLGAVIPAAAGFAESTRAGLASYLGDSTKARTGLGWKCRDLRQGLGETVAAWDASRRVRE